MENNDFNKVKKTITILLILCFVLSVTAISASATDNGKHHKKNSHYSGYKDGYKIGYKDGKKQGQKDCIQYGNKQTLQKIPEPFNKKSWSREYKKAYNKGYVDGYIEGYSKSRYRCLH